MQIQNHRKSLEKSKRKQTLFSKAQVPVPINSNKKEQATVPAPP